MKANNDEWGFEDLGKLKTVEQACLKKYLLQDLINDLITLTGILIIGVLASGFGFVLYVVIPTVVPIIADKLLAMNIGDYIFPIGIFICVLLVVLVGVMLVLETGMEKLKRAYDYCVTTEYMAKLKNDQKKE